MSKLTCLSCLQSGPLCLTMFSHVIVCLTPTRHLINGVASTTMTVLIAGPKMQTLERHHIIPIADAIWLSRALIGNCAQSKNFTVVCRVATNRSVSAGPLAGHPPKKLKATGSRHILRHGSIADRSSHVHPILRKRARSRTLRALANLPAVGPMHKVWCRWGSGRLLATPAHMPDVLHVPLRYLQYVPDTRRAYRDLPQLGARGLDQVAG